ncbi:hypothetical protein BT96DRAFT_951119 [Gymnopus androsaceus JB14]|uniref:Uncharacterized protein n=1 Tax=Gymnopus androsaceus JB14 TaxID=1447944 RepID=A0A6A4GE93_9AGAR|nr:hypothetical protein BT96DRAFT_951119 [Gymnopus androsaceus JB14]
MYEMSEESTRNLISKYGIQLPFAERALISGRLFPLISAFAHEIIHRHLPNRFLQWEAAEPRWQGLLDYWKNQANPLDDKGPYPRTLEIVPKSKNTPLTYTLDDIDCGSTVMVSATYPAMVERLFGRYQRKYINHTGVLITGQPGTGKSIFLWYLLAVLLTLKDDSPVPRAPVLFYHDVHIILFYNDRAYTPISPSTFDFTIVPRVSASNSSIWALIDVDAKAEEPVGLAAALRVFAVQAASPDPKRYRIWLERRHARFLSGQSKNFWLGTAAIYPDNRGN